MGFFSGFFDVGKNIKRAGRQISRTASDIWKELEDIGPIAGIAAVNPALPVGSALLAKKGLEKINQSPEKPPTPGEDPRQTALRGSLTQSAKEFRQDLPGYTGQREKGLLSQYRQALDSGTRKTKENYARRGLLYSGLERGAQTNLRGQLASQLAKGRSDIAFEGEELARKKEMAAAAAGLNSFNQLMNQSEQYYNMSMANDLARRKAIGSLAKGIGYGFGAYSGRNQTGGGGYSSSGPYTWSGNEYTPQYVGGSGLLNA